MASNINYASIDRDYPIAGKDNDSQGFRDNFGYIKDSLQSAKGEIETLQENTAKTNEDNDFHFQTLSKAQLKNWGETVHDGGTIGNDTLVSYSDGSIQIFKIDANLSLIIEGFPQEGIAGKLRIHLTNNVQNNVVTPHTVSFALQGGAFKTNNIFSGYTGSISSSIPRLGYVGSVSGITTNPVVVTSSSNPVVIDLWTYDGGSTVFMNYLGQFI